MAASTLTGTTGNNLLNAPGSVSTLVQGLAGNDTIVLSRADDEGQAGTGNDSIALTRTGTVSNTIFGGAGTDTVFIRSSTIFGGYVDLGAGTDSIRFATAAGTTSLVDANVFGGEGNDTLAISARVTTSTVGAGSGTDILNFTAAQLVTSSLVFGGKQKDTITFNGATGRDASIGGGKGADILAVSQSGALATTNVGGGQGTDSITAGANAVGSISGGGLNDTITLGGFGGGRVYGDAVGITTAGTGTGGAADGADLINIAAAATANTTINGAGGSDTIAFASGALLGVTRGAGIVDAGDGTDSIRLVGSAANIALVSGTSINGGAGNDTISLGARYATGGEVNAMGTINGGAGTDLIIFGGADGGIEVISEAASALTGLTATLILDNVSGDTLRIGNNAAVTANTIQNWARGAASIQVASTISALTTTHMTGGATSNTTGAGNISVFSDGNDTLIVVNSNAASTSSYAIFVNGRDLVTTTRTGAVTLAASNFGFSVTAAGDDGINIAFS